MIRSGLVLLFAVMLVTVMAVLAPSQPASAQTETPTPSVTPPYQYQVQIATSTTLLVERRITYGEIAVVGAILLLFVGSVIFWILRAVRLWIY